MFNCVFKNVHYVFKTCLMCMSQVFNMYSDKCPTLIKKKSNVYLINVQPIYIKCSTCIYKKGTCI